MSEAPVGVDAPRSGGRRVTVRGAGAPVVAQATVAVLLGVATGACGGDDVDRAASPESVVTPEGAETDDVTATDGAPGAGASTTSAPDSVGGEAGSVTYHDLDGREFVAQSIEGHELVPGSQILLGFSGESMTISGCNGMGTNYVLDGGTLTTGDEWWTTEVACEEALMAQDDLFARVLLGGASTSIAPPWSGVVAGVEMPVILDGGELVFETASGTVTFLDREIAEPDAPIEGTRWIRVATEREGGWFDPGRAAALTIAHVTAELDNGCLSASGPVEVASDTITFGPLTPTGPDCDRPARRFEKMMFRNLSGGEFCAVAVSAHDYWHNPGKMVVKVRDLR